MNGLTRFPLSLPTGSLRLVVAVGLAHTNDPKINADGLFRAGRDTHVGLVKG